MTVPYVLPMSDSGIETTVPGGRGAAGGGLGPDSPVEVRTRFDGRWVGGFRILGREGAGLRIARCSDGSALPVLFGLEEVRPSAPPVADNWPVSA